VLAQRTERKSKTSGNSKSYFFGSIILAMTIIQIWTNLNKLWNGGSTPYSCTIKQCW
jgi:hypothetical protein